MQEDFLEIDARYMLEQGRSPLPLIVNTVASLKPGQRLRLLAPYEPKPLYDLMRGWGFEREARQESEELWVVEFTRVSEGEPPGAMFAPPRMF